MTLGENNSIVPEVPVVVRMKLEPIWVEEEDCHEIGD